MLKNILKCLFIFSSMYVIADMVSYEAVKRHYSLDHDNDISDDFVDATEEKIFRGGESNDET